MRGAGSAFFSVALILSGSFAASSIGAEPPQETAQETSGSSTTTKTAEALESKHVSERLDRAIEADKTILARFDEVMEELEIIKVRATMKRSTRRR